jgi:hypothetical protein
MNLMDDKKMKNQRNFHGGFISTCSRKWRGGNPRVTHLDKIVRSSDYKGVHYNFDKNHVIWNYFVD